MDCVMRKVLTMSRHSFSEMDTMHWELIPPTVAWPCSRGEITGMPCSPVGVGWVGGIEGGGFGNQDKTEVEVSWGWVGLGVWQRESELRCSM